MIHAIIGSPDHLLANWKGPKVGVSPNDRFDVFTPSGKIPAVKWRSGTSEWGKSHQLSCKPGGT